MEEFCFMSCHRIADKPEKSCPTLSAHLDSRRRRGKFRSWCHEQQQLFMTKIDGQQKPGLFRWQPTIRKLFVATFCSWYLRLVWHGRGICTSVSSVWCSQQQIKSLIRRNWQQTWYLHWCLYWKKKTFSYGTVSWLDVCVTAIHLLCQLHNFHIWIGNLAVQANLWIFLLALCSVKQAAIFCLNTCQT